jgi:radical SAM protein with 4Fe4S-binding SPASM domain
MQSFKNNDKKFMDISTFGKIVSQAKEFDTKLKQVNFAGWGSPLLNPILPNMVFFLKISNVTENIAIITNGILLSHEMSYELVEAGIDHIRISIQGIGSKRYKQISGKKVDFDELVDNIRWLYSHKKQCKVSVKVADIGLEEGEEQLFYDTFKDISDQMYIERIRPMFKENNNDGKAVSKYGHEHLPVLVCPQPFFMMSVTASGDILPCCSFYDPSNLGNINNTTLKEVWNSKKLKDFQLMLLSRARKVQSHYPVCASCLMPDAVITPGDELDDKVDEIKRRMK